MFGHLGRLRMLLLVECHIEGCLDVLYHCLPTTVLSQMVSCVNKIRFDL